MLILIELNNDDHTFLVIYDQVIYDDEINFNHLSENKIFVFVFVY